MDSPYSNESQYINLLQFIIVMLLCFGSHWSIADEPACQSLFKSNFQFAPNFGRERHLPWRGDQLFEAGSVVGAPVFIVVPLTKRSNLPQVYFEKGYGSEDLIYARKMRALKKIEDDLKPFRVVKVLETYPVRLEFVPGRTVLEIALDPHFPKDLKSQILTSYRVGLRRFDQSWAAKHSASVRVNPLHENLPSIDVYRNKSREPFFFISPFDVIVDARDLSLNIINPI